MILEIPSGDEYERSSVSLLNLSWNTAATLTRNLEAVNLREWDDDARTQAQYWERWVMLTHWWSKPKNLG